jgi:hypothetical protein
MLDGVPVLDIKRYIREFDFAEAESIGWLRDHISELEMTEDNGRFCDWLVKQYRMTHDSRDLHGSTFFSAWA